MPRFLGWHDDVLAPILLLEDLSAAHWPPPWQSDQINQILNTLPALWSTNLTILPHLSDLTYVWDGWQQVANQPEPFLGLRLVSERWLEQALPVLLSINGRQLATGEALLHLDLRSDNMCLVGNRVVFVDWNWMDDVKKI